MQGMVRCRLVSLICLILLLVSACGSPAQSSGSDVVQTALPQSPAPSPTSTTKLRLATTTSTADSGLLDALLPDFEQRYNADVEVVAVGTGQALKLGENGDADVVLVHARKREDEFVAQGFGINRRDVMYNDFVIVGPESDPAQIATAANAAEAFSSIAARSATFTSRGDDSGTYSKEQALWSMAAITPTAELSWYKSLGQGMGETLITANELGAYTLTDRGTYLSMRDKLPNLRIWFGGETIAENTDNTLRNPYGVIQVNPAKHQGISGDLSGQFVEWITSAEVQKRIGTFGIDTFGQPLFYPQAQQ